MAIAEKDARRAPAVEIEDDPTATLAHENLLGFAALLAILFAAAEGP